MVYYTFFGVIVLLTAGLGASVNHKSWKPFYKSIVYTIISALTVFIMLFPFNINKIKNGRNAEIVERTYDEAER